MWGVVVGCLCEWEFSSRVNTESMPALVFSLTPLSVSEISSLINDRLALCFLLELASISNKN